MESSHLEDSATPPIIIQILRPKLELLAAKIFYVDPKAFLFQKYLFGIFAP